MLDTSAAVIEQVRVPGSGLVAYLTRDPFELYGILVAPLAVIGVVRARTRAHAYFVAIALGEIAALGLTTHAEGRYVLVASTLLAVLGLAAIVEHLGRAALALVAASWLSCAVMIGVSQHRVPAAERVRGAANPRRRRGAAVRLFARAIPQLMWYAGCGGGLLKRDGAPEHVGGARVVRGGRDRLSRARPRRDRARARRAPGAPRPRRVAARALKRVLRWPRVQPRQPSLTARGAAGHRAAHQVLEGGAIFRDPFARAILGAEGCAHADERAADPATRPLRLFIAARSRFAEDAAAAAIARGVRQVVVLGAGLDTFGLAQTRTSGTHARVRGRSSGTQAWKRARLAEEGLAVPGTFSGSSGRFRARGLEARPARGGRASTALFPRRSSWLGVVPYLTRDAVLAVLASSRRAPGSEIAFDYDEPPRRTRARSRRSPSASPRRASRS